MSRIPKFDHNVTPPTRKTEENNLPPVLGQIPGRCFYSKSSDLPKPTMTLNTVVKP